MQEISNLDYFYLAKELQALVGERLGNIYCANGAYRFKIAKKNLLVNFGKGIWLSDAKIAAEGPPETFVMLLRKHLGNARLASIRQLNSDRILCLEFEKAKRFFVVLEMFRKGNLLLCDEDMKIMAPLHGEEYASRKLRKGQPYTPPPMGKANPQELDAKPSTAEQDAHELRELPPLKGRLVPALSKAVNLSPFYLEEACARASLDYSTEASALSQAQKKELLEALKSLFEGFSTRLYFEDGKPIAFSPVELNKYAGKESKAFNAFSAALDEYFSVPAEKEEPPELKKLRYLLEQQEKAVGELEEKAREAKEKGDAVYANHALVESALAGKAETRRRETKIELELPE